MLNKIDGDFTPADLQLLEGITTQCAMTLETMQLVERTARSRRREIDFLNVVSDLTSELDLGRLLGRVMSEATRMLDADRSTLFLNDEKTGELFSYIGDRLETEIRFPNHIGIAGAVFTTGSPSTSRTPTPTCASTRRSTGRPATSRARSSACRSSTRRARRSASRRC